ncbi:nicotinate (nicotinamide) nucleotide adenylyltransferase [Porphyromonas loveana]|uniref:nicotinate (nicotinamide) nucleotide adenylyltransferase n=1 Tax=Porphyromonas loveana TaxID=1884669 RepID=UPI0035A01490
MQTGLYFGSFNPIHIGHLALANYLTEHTSIRQLWFIPSPINPLKNSRELLPYELRCRLIEQAVRGDHRFRVLRIESTLPAPHYTVRTLRALSMLHPDQLFTLLIGADNWLSFDRWQDHQRLLDHYPLTIYPRLGYKIDEASLPSSCHYVLEAPRIEISSTAIRSGILQGRDLRYWLPQPDTYNVIAAALRDCAKR